MKIDIKFTPDVIVVPAMELPSKEIGAVVEFQGLVREMEGEDALEGLFYEVYEEMARNVLEGHLSELGGIHGCTAVEFIHRLGWVPVGEASLYIRVLSSHRVEGLRFLADSIDRLKLDVPIWKRV
ncbi:MAG: molybdenum cofactor biosynthesis protein MoaE [Verrucomicrobia bacterium]|nr:molybdenum cofactor biosynthesis protein MoaE [Verrucomicrobiota bacterium]|tara:strand:- start:11032 stop:11406 length:375 start_codon:yes stop_codon:yes gene_type:complete